MLGDQGIAGEIQRKKEAYQGNPQALQQQYQQSQQLVDLLALQQLKSEKEAAARQMQMQMQQNPATIAQQREQEVLGMIKQEQGRKLGDVARRTAGTLNQINKGAQQNMQRTAKQGLPAVGGSQMAAGGIVGFTSGGGVTDDEIDEYLARNPLESDLPRKVIAGRIASAKRAGTYVGGTRARLTDSAKKKVPAAIAAKAKGFPNEPKEEPKPEPEPKLEPTEPVDQTPYGTALAEVLQAGPKGNQLDENLAIGAKETSLSGKAESIADSLVRTDEQIKARETAAEQEADRLTGRSEGIAALKEQETELADFDRRYSDPDQLRSQALMAGLLSAGSGPLARAGAGMFNAEREQERQLRNMLKGRQELRQKRIDHTRLTGTQQLEAINKVRAEDSADRRAAKQAYVDLSTSEQARLDGEANRKVSVARGNQAANSAQEGQYIDMLTSLAESERRRIDSLEARQQAGALDATNAIAEIANIRAEIRAKKQEAESLLVQSDPRYAAIDQAIREAQEEDDAEDLAAAMAQLNELKAQAAADSAALGVAELESKLDALEESLSGLVSPSTSTSPPTIKPSEIVAARPS